MNVEYRVFLASDYEAAHELWRKADGIALSDVDSRTGITRYLERNPGLSLVAVKDGAVIATVLCGHDGRRGFLHHLYVDPRFRRSGIGRELVNRALSGLQTQDVSKSHLFVLRANAEGVAFWGRIGGQQRQDLEVFSFATAQRP